VRPTSQSPYYFLTVLVRRPLAQLVAVWFVGLICILSFCLTQESLVGELRNRPLSESLYFTVFFFLEPTTGSIEYPDFVKIDEYFTTFKGKADRASFFIDRDYKLRDQRDFRYGLLLVYLHQEH
jgi:hypothetical protein